MSFWSASGLVFIYFWVVACLVCWDSGGGSPPPQGGRSAHLMVLPKMLPPGHSPSTSLCTGHRLLAFWNQGSLQLPTLLHHPQGRQEVGVVSADEVQPEGCMA